MDKYTEYLSSLSQELELSSDVICYITTSGKMPLLWELCINMA